MKNCILLTIFTLLLISCEEDSLKDPFQVIDDDENENADSVARLSELYSSDFLIGVSMGSDLTQNGVDDVSHEIITTHFNSIVAGNTMKPRYLQPLEGSFNFNEADFFVNYGLRNDMFIIGHTLLWHNQIPDWIFIDKAGNDVTREVLLQRLKNHIFTVVDRYKGEVKGWDVVNEVIDNGILRETKWLQIIGPDYIDSAFHYASIADPEAELYYNDFNMNTATKRNRAVQLIQHLKSENIKIDGIGMQAHYNLNTDISEVEKSIIAFSEQGVKVMITELDISVLQTPPWGEIDEAVIGVDPAFDAKYNPYVDGLPEEVDIQLANKYKAFFEMFLKHSDKITRVTFWGYNDGASWKNNFPIKGRTDYPLLFDRDYMPKRAFYEILNLKQ